MLKTKGFVKPSYITHHSKNQSGNTLIPVIIALAISAVASVAFLKQGADLSAQAKVLEAQYEVAAILQEWNRLKSSGSIGSISATNFPSATYRTNVYNSRVTYATTFAGNQYVLRYSGFKNMTDCNRVSDSMTNLVGVAGSLGPQCLSVTGGIDILVKLE
jgi:Tfp pilus assembly protein PilV